MPRAFGDKFLICRVNHVTVSRDCLCPKQVHCVINRKRRFGHEETDTHCVCGQKRAQLHPFSCPKAREYRPHLWCTKRQKQLAPEEVLGTPEGVAIFAKWAPATGLFHRRYRALGTFDEGEKDDTQE